MEYLLIRQNVQQVNSVYVVREIKNKNRRYFVC